MDARQAQTLQQHALDSLAELRSWLGARAAEHAHAAEGARSAAYATWGTQVEAAIRAVKMASAECERRSGPPPPPAEPQADSVPPTLPSHGARRPGGLLPPPSSAEPGVNALPPSSAS